MIFGAVLAGGVGSRMKHADKPKQFLPLGEKPIMLHSVQKFIDNPRFDRIYIGINAEWIDYLEEILNTYKIDRTRLTVVCGGNDRNSTIMNIIADIRKNISADDNDIIVTHDAVRPFITRTILDGNIDSALEHGACGTAIPTVDTIVKSDNGEAISDFYDRTGMYNQQTPQSFNITELYDLYTALSDSQRQVLTDACRIFSMHGKQVRIVNGDPCNLKITTDSDYQIAQAIHKYIALND